MAHAIHIAFYGRPNIYMKSCYIVLDFCLSSCINKQQFLDTGRNKKTNILVNCPSRGLLTDVVRTETFTDRQDIYWRKQHMLHALISMWFSCQSVFKQTLPWEHRHDHVICIASEHRHDHVIFTATEHRHDHVIFTASQSHIYALRVSPNHVCGDYI